MDVIDNSIDAEASAHLRLKTASNRAKISKRPPSTVIALV